MCSWHCGRYFDYTEREEMMMEGEANNSRSKKKRAVPYDYGFTDTVFSWSLEDIFNEDLFKDKVCFSSPFSSSFCSLLNNFFFWIYISSRYEGLAMLTYIHTKMLFWNWDLDSFSISPFVLWDCKIKNRINLDLML